MHTEIHDDPSRFIPISDVVKDWQKSSFAEELLRYAPKLEQELYKLRREL